MRRLDSRFEGESEPPLLPAPSQKSSREQLWIGDPPARQELLLKPENTNGDIARFILLFQGDQGSRIPTAKRGQYITYNQSPERESTEHRAVERASLLTLTLYRVGWRRAIQRAA
jgi:hypothetical protein